MAGQHGAVTAWRRWGPYAAGAVLGHRPRGLQRDGNAWAYFPHDHARSRAYRWGEDGWPRSATATRSSASHRLWNERDPILKERLFGVVPSEGNHGEDVKEYYFYLDSTPSHSYMKWLYKYPQRSIPYQRSSRRTSGAGPRPGVRAARHRHLRRRPLLRRLRGVRQGDPRGHGRPRHRPQPRSGGGADPRAPAPLVPQYLGLGTARRRALDRHRGDGPAGTCSCRRLERRSPVQPSVPLSPRTAEAGRPIRRRALFTNNETHAQRLYGPERRAARRT
jgi:hypothetical protein